MDMKRIEIRLQDFPEVLRPFLTQGEIFDCSCSDTARTLCIKTEDAELFLKEAPKDFLKREAIMTDWFAKKNLAKKILCYVSEEKDYLLKEGVAGIDLTTKECLQDPEGLCKLYAEALHLIHSLDPKELPQDPCCTEWINDGYQSPLLKADTVIHGDYCLPNVIVQNGAFEGFIDLGQACLGDKHIDIYWALWSLEFNLKTDQYRDCFLDHYGRDQIDETILEVIRKEEEGA